MPKSIFSSVHPNDKRICAKCEYWHLKTSILRLYIMHFSRFNVWDLKKSTYLKQKSHFLTNHWHFYRFEGPPPSCATGGGCLRRFGDLRKNTPLDFWSMYLVDFVDFCRCWGPKVVPLWNDADCDCDSPTTAMPHSHQQAPRTGIKYPVQGKPLTLMSTHGNLL